MIKIFIGYDSKEPAAYHVLAHSIITRSSVPVEIAPLCLGQLGAFYHRERTGLESTEFSMTRFLVPFLSGYEGYSIFMDCDMLCLCDMADIVKSVSYMNKAVTVCKHTYTPKTATKFLGQQQTVYPRKNWSSFMVFETSACGQLTPDYVNSASGLDLHRFNWIDDSKIGSLPLEWNWLVGEYPDNPQAKILHYTLGGPWFKETRNCDRAEDWNREYRMMTNGLYLNRD